MTAGSGVDLIREYQESARGEFVHPIHGGHPLSWPPVFDQWISFPVNRIVSTILRGDITLLVARGSIDIHFNQLIYDNRLNIGRIAWGKSEVTTLTSITNTEQRDLPWFQELMGICVVRIQLRNGDIIATLNFRGCHWPDNIREPTINPLRHETAVVAALQAYGNLAGLYAANKHETWIKDAGMVQFYQDWKEIENAGKRPDEVQEFLTKWRKAGKLV